MSSSLITYLELTRDVVAEAYEALRVEQDAQSNRAEILGATRFKTYQRARVYHTKRPHLYCYSTDSFLHMLECYALLDSVLKGAHSVAFLVNMARISRRKKGSVPIPYLEEVTDASRGRVAAQLRGVTAVAAEEQNGEDDERARGGDSDGGSAGGGGEDG